MKIKYLTAAILCCLLLSACTDLSLTGYDILSPPRAQGARGRLRDQIIQSLGDTYTPVYPASGDYLNAVVERDIDADGTNEAIALCRDGDESIRVLAFRRSGSSYTEAGHITVPGTRIDKVEFADLDKDGSEELILLYPDADSPQSSLTVVSMGDTVTDSDMLASYNRCIISDIDGDGQRDILLLRLSGEVVPASASLLGYRDGKLEVTASCEMDSQVVEIDRITCGTVGEGVVGVFADGHNAAGEYTTQVLYRDPAQGELLNPLFIYRGYESTRRSEHIFCSDVDMDGLVEFPVVSPCDSGEKEAPETVCRRLTWNNYRTYDMELISKKTAVLCEDEGFLFNIGNERVGTVTARYIADDTVAVYQWEFSGGELRCTDLLVTLRRYPADSYDSESARGTQLTAVGDAIYTYELGPSGAHSYTDEEVKRCFTPIETS